MVAKTTIVRRGWLTGLVAGLILDRRTASSIARHVKDWLAMPRRSTPVLVFALLLAFAPIVLGQDSPSDERDRAVMNRFLSIVEKAPRRGTAFDRVYGYHVERGSLDAFLKTYQDRTVASARDGAAWLMIGLVESQRGRDSAAVAALRQAETARADDPMPSYYLGQSLVLVGQPDDAAQAFERAIARKPNRADLLEIFQALGRVYQRAHRNEQALAVWSRLEKIFPRRPEGPGADRRLARRGSRSPTRPCPRYEALAKATKDRFRQVQFQIDAAELKVRLNRTTDALADFEGLLGKLDPESWLHREVRRKIEEIFTKGDDLAGLASYYEKWIKKTPDDVEAMARLGKALTLARAAGRGPGVVREGGEPRPESPRPPLGPDRATPDREEVPRGRRPVRGDRQDRPEQPRRYPRVGPRAPPRRVEVGSRPPEGRLGHLAKGSPKPGPTTHQRWWPSPTCSASAEMNDEAIGALSSGAVGQGPGLAAVFRVPGRILPPAQAAHRGPGDLVEDGRTAQPQRQDPGPARARSSPASATRPRRSPRRPRPPRSTATTSTSSSASPTSSTPPASSTTRRSNSVSPTRPPRLPRSSAKRSSTARSRTSRRRASSPARIDVLRQEIEREASDASPRHFA